MRRPRTSRVRRSPGWLRILMLLLFCLHLGNTGLPGVSIHHSKSEGVKHCNCGCDCSHHPDASDSCLNPRNTQELSCGCRKEHSRVFDLPAPTFSPVLLPEGTPPLPAPTLLAWTFPDAERFRSRPLEPRPAPPS
jgi:hypothetical protein